MSFAVEGPFLPTFFGCKKEVTQTASLAGCCLKNTIQRPNEEAAKVTHSFI